MAGDLQTGSLARRFRGAVSPSSRLQGVGSEEAAGAVRWEEPAVSCRETWSPDPGLASGRVAGTLSSDVCKHKDMFRINWRWTGTVFWRKVGVNFR